MLITKGHYPICHPVGLARLVRSISETSAGESTIYDKLKKGPVFEKAINNIIPRESLVKEIRQLITPTEESRLYALIIGGHGTGKTSLIKLAADGMDEPKGVVYVDVEGDAKCYGMVSRSGYRF
jgi:hypothetical protein